MIHLVKNTIDKVDIDQLIKWLQTYPQLTKGKQTEYLEKKWARFVGTEYSVFVNSGSSALLLMIYALIELGTLPRGSKVVVPALSWATDLAPVIQFNLQPILCDNNMKDLSVDLNCLEKIFKNENPKALILVSVLGLVPNMDEIVRLCKEYDVILLEDVCESTGSKYKDQNLGTFGLMSTYSCYFGHHFSTIEGGFINTDDYEVYNLLKMLRSHGWNRDLDDKAKKELGFNNGSAFNNLYRFYVPGFNLRSTDLQAFIGIKQIDKLNKITMVRNDNFIFYMNNIKNDYWMPDVTSHFVSNFAFPIIHPNREKIVKEFEKNNIEIRPLICGSMGTQPMYEKRYGSLKLPKVSIVDKYGCYIPNHSKLSREELDKIVGIVNACIKEC